MDDADSTEIAPAPTRGDSRRGGGQTPLLSLTLRSMDRDTGELRHPHGTFGHLRQLGIEVVEFQTYESEEDS